MMWIGSWILTPAHAACRSLSIHLSHSPIRFQLANGGGHQRIFSKSQSLSVDRSIGRYRRDPPVWAPVWHSVNIKRRLRIDREVVLTRAFSRRERRTCLPAAIALRPSAHLGCRGAWHASRNRVMKEAASGSATAAASDSCGCHIARARQRRSVVTGRRNCV